MTTAYLSANYPGMMVLARNRFNNEILPLLAEDELEALANSIGDPQRVALIDQCGLNLPRPYPQNQGNSNLVNAEYRTKVAQFKHIVKRMLSLF
jgi:hypothetical protein